MPWHVVYTNASREEFASDMLRERGYPVLYPHYVTIARHARAERERTKPRFPRYIFAAVEGNLSIYGINTCPGVSTVLHGPNGPLALSEAVMAEIRAPMLNDDGLCPTPTGEERARLHHGVVVRVKRGPFEGFLATVGLDSGVAVKIWIEVFGRPNEVEIAPDWVEPTTSPGLSETSKPPRRDRPPASR